MNIKQLYKNIKEHEFKYEKHRTWNSIDLEIDNEILKINISNYILEYYCSGLDFLTVSVKINNDKIEIIDSEHTFKSIDDLMSYLNEELLKKIKNNEMEEFKYPETLIINFEANFNQGWTLKLKENYTEEQKKSWLKIEKEVLKKLNKFDKELSYKEKEKFYKILKLKLIEIDLIDEDFKELFQDIKSFNIIFQ